MDFGKGTQYIISDKGWLGKMTVAGLLILSVIGSPAVLGWMVEISRRAAHDEDDLPDWDEIGEYYLDGLSYLVITAVWVMPFFVLTIGLGTFMVVLSGMNGGGTTDLEDSMGMILFGLNMLGMVNILGAMLLAVPLIGLIGGGHSVLKLLNPMHALRLFFRNIGTYLTVIIMGWFASVLFMMAGLAACGVGIFIAGPFAYAYFGHLSGQAYAIAIENSNVSNEDGTSSKEEDVEEIPPAI